MAGVGRVGKVRPGQKVFIQAGSGGVGTITNNSPSISAQQSRLPRAQRVPNRSELSEQMLLSTTTHRISRRSFRATILCCIVKAQRRLRNRCGCSSPAASSFLFPVPRSRFRRGIRPEPIPETGSAFTEQRSSEKGKSTRRSLFIPVQARAEAAVE